MAQLTPHDVYFDCEFNGFRGYFISIAFVPVDPSLPECYLIKTPVGAVDPWVYDNVLNVLYEEGMELDPICGHDSNNLRRKLASYLWQLHLQLHARGQRINLVADWPADPIYFFDLLLDPDKGGEMMSVPPFTVEFRRNMKKVAALNPHNALSDARAMARANREE
jgi:hypothetical protein